MAAPATEEATEEKCREDGKGEENEAGIDLARKARVLLDAQADPQRLQLPQRPYSQRMNAMAAMAQDGAAMCEFYAWFEAAQGKERITELTIDERLTAERAGPLKPGDVADLCASFQAAIVDVILHDEIRHVAIGNHWFHWLCARDQIDADAFYAQAAVKHGAPRLKPPFNIEARRRAGFSEQELQALPAQ